MALPQLRPATEHLEVPDGTRERRGRFAGVSWVMWGLLILSIAFLASVRFVADRQEANWRSGLDHTSDLQGIATYTPDGPVSATALELSWEQILEADHYRLTVSTIAGDVVIDQLLLGSSFWSPPPEALPALPRGDYQWSVEAVDVTGTVIAQSAKAPLRIGTY